MNGSHLREFDRFRIDLEKKVLWGDGEPVHLPAKAVEVLCVLVENRGEVVTKDELLTKVWENSFVEESVLAQNIHHLRKTFRDFDFRENPIQTIPRRGYRFAGDVHEISGEFVIEHEVVERSLLAEISEDSLKDLGLRNITKISRSKHSHRTSRVVLASMLLLAVFLLIGFAAWSSNQSNEQAASKTVRSIAVLPLKSLGGNEPDRTFSLGLTDSLISRLGKLNRFAVRPFSAVEKYEKSGRDAIGFGQELRVDSVLEGTIQTVDNRLRVNLRLLDVKNGRQLWTGNFDETESDIFKLQDSISARVAHFLLDKLEPEEKLLLAGKPTASAEAYRLYLTGRERWMRRDGTADCLRFYQKAIELDPNFALAYLGIADLYAFTYETETAEDALARAIELDPNLAEAHATRGFLQMFHRWDWPGAENSFRRALELAPNSPKTHHWYGVYLSIRGRFDEAQREMERALELDPTALVIMTDIAELYFFRRDYDRAEAELEKVLEIDPNFLNARMHLIKVRYKKGASYFLEEAAFSIFRQKQLKTEGLAQDFNPAELERLLAARDEKTLQDKSLKSILAALGSRADAYLSLSRYYSMTGEKEKSLDALEKAQAGKAFVTPFAGVDPMWDAVRNEPGFQAILKKMNL